MSHVLLFYSIKTKESLILTVQNTVAVLHNFLKNEVFKKSSSSSFLVEHF